MTIHPSLQQPLRSWIVFPAVGVFAVAISVGLLSQAATVAVATTVVHGRVAGATVTRSGPVTMRINDGTDERNYEIMLTQPVSVYGLLLLAERDVHVNVEWDTTAAPRLKTLNEMTATRQWDVSVDGKPVDDVTMPVIAPGSTVIFSLPGA